MRERERERLRYGRERETVQEREGESEIYIHTHAIGGTYTRMYAIVDAFIWLEIYGGWKRRGGLYQ